MRIRALGLATILLAAAPLLAEQPPPVLRIPGTPDGPLDPASLLVGRDERDVRIEDVQGNVTIYHGTPLLAVLERNGLDLRTMAGERKSAAQVVVATARDGYSVVFSVGELRMQRGNPKVFLVSETSTGPLPENEGTVRLIVYGDTARSAYGLARIELRVIAENPSAARK
ncbi:MAG TPA: hypothetical protein VGL03_00540 [Thermoanaerobaculia bacterium]|jgi:hypothetical protein